MCVCVAVYNSLSAELEHEKQIREGAETKQKELQATEAQQQQKIHDLESQICDLEAAKVNSVCALFVLLYKRVIIRRPVRLTLSDMLSLSCCHLTTCQLLLSQEMSEFCDFARAEFCAELAILHRINKVA